MHILHRQHRYAFAVGYAPTQSCLDSNNQREKFFEDGTTLLSSTPTSRRTVIGGDFNSHLGADAFETHGVTGTRAPALQHSIWPVRGVSPLEVTNAQWTEGVVSQSSPFPDGENVISVTFSANVPLGPAQVRQRRLVPAFSLAIRHRAWRLYSHLLL